ncbi:MAG: hypothetical protein QG671_3590 [Actinomycetota bacterium]|nr:hypothetical protein [Actinomycetota bacterium]
MTIGLATAHANALLNIFRATNFTAVTVYVQLHTGDPGVAGTANTSAVTTRNSASFAAPAGGSMSLSAALTAWSMTASETISHISLWDAATGGSFLRSAALTTSRTVISNDTFTLSTLTLSYTPLAA